MIRHRGVVLLVALLALIASSCGGSSTGEVATTTAPSSDSGDAAAPSDSPADADGGDDDSSDDDASSEPAGELDEGDSMAASSPIGAFFADDGGFDAAIAEYTARVEEAIVICMAEQGFEFARSENNFNEVQDLQNEMTEREWTSEFGYGISTSFDSVAQNQATDPNAEIIFSLSASEREIWVETLTGGGFDAVGGDFNSTPLEEQGCIGAALISTGGQEAIEGLETFGDAYDEGEEALLDRREMVEVIDAWTRCMGEAGYPGYSDLEDPEESIGTEFEEVIAPMQEALDNLTSEEGQALVSGESFDLADLPDLDLDSLRELQDREIAVALVDLDCYEAEVKATYEPLRDEFENGLLEEYSTEFNAIKNIGS